MTQNPAGIHVVVRPGAALASAALRELFLAAWPGDGGPHFDLERSLCWASAHAGDRLVGFVNVVGDGGVHAFVLDTTVHPDFRRQGIGLELVRCAADEARELGAEWLHVDYEPEHAPFYRRCGFRPTAAGLLGLLEHTEPLARGLLEDGPRLVLRKYSPSDSAACRELMAGLSDWFTLPAAVDAYLSDLARVPTWLATLGEERRVAGFVSVTAPQPRAFEVHVLAVARDLHGHGIGRALMTLAERWSSEQGARFLQVKTLGPSHDDPHYDKTRGFYAHLGYESLFETDKLWGEGNPTLILVKALAAPRSR
jgi:GNAT superfamily N-acetyltransferase